MRRRSHVVLAGAAYAALTDRPVETPLGTLMPPILAGLTTSPSMVQALGLFIAAACGLAPDLWTSAHR